MLNALAPYKFYPLRATPCTILTLKAPYIICVYNKIPVIPRAKHANRQHSWCPPLPGVVQQQYSSSARVCLQRLNLPLSLRQEADRVHLCRVVQVRVPLPLPCASHFDPAHAPNGNPL